MELELDPQPAEPPRRPIQVASWLIHRSNQTQTSINLVNVHQADMKRTFFKR
jgi:hypothetical protein